MRCFPRRLCFWTALLLAAHLLLLDAAPAVAGLAPSRRSGTTGVESVRAADMIVLQRALEHRVVAQKLKDYGVTPEEARSRLASLSDQDLHQLASMAHGLPSGGDGLGAVVTLLVIVILVIVVVKLLNKDIVIK